MNPPNSSSPVTPDNSPTPASSSAAPPEPCVSARCKNDRVCVLDNEGQAVCRCAVGQDWWYYGDRCQFKSSTQSSVLTAVLASVGVFVIMLMVTVISVFCVKKKQRKVQLEGHGITMKNMNSFA